MQLLITVPWTCDQRYLEIMHNLNIHIHIMDLARGTYSSVHMLVSACWVPSDYLNSFHTILTPNQEQLYKYRSVIKP